MDPSESLHPSRRLLSFLLAPLLLAAGCRSGNEPQDTVPCFTNADCNNGAFCDGEETCDFEGRCADGTAPTCDDADPCTVDRCDPDADSCINVHIDEDGDGSFAMRTPEGEDCGGTDCDDGDETVYPGAPEVCLDGTDQDCDGIVDGLVPLVDDLRITEDDATCYSRAIEWNGSRFVIVWEDYREGQDEIYFRNVTADGGLISTDVRITDTAFDSICSSVQWTGSSYSICWCEGPVDERQVMFARIDADGAPIGSATQITDSSGSASTADMVWTGSVLGLCWGDDGDGYYDVFFILIDLDGGALSSVIQVTDTELHTMAPSLAWSGSEFALAWYEYPATARQISFARLDEQGLLMGMPVIISESTADADHPELTWAGSRYGVAWEDDRHVVSEIYFAQVSAEGEKIGSDVRITSTAVEAKQPSLTWTGSEYSMTWTDYKEGVEAIFFARFDGDGRRIGTEIRISGGSESADNSKVVWTGTGYGICWRDARDGNNEIYAEILGFCD